MIAHRDGQKYVYILTLAFTINDLFGIAVTNDIIIIIIIIIEAGFCHSTNTDPLVIRDMGNHPLIWDFQEFFYRVEVSTDQTDGLQ